jgi:hypothetical protein
MELTMAKSGRAASDGSYFDSKMTAGLFGSKRHRATAVHRPNATRVLAHAITTNHRYASEYWIWAVAAGRVYNPDQRCRCPRCLRDVPDRVSATPDGPMTIRGGRLWPRQAAETTKGYFECRVLASAPPDASHRQKWKPRKPRTEDSGWCGERGAWRRRMIGNDEKIKACDIRIRLSRSIIAWEESTVVNNAEQNTWGVYEQVVTDPLMLAEVNAIDAEGFDAGLVESLALLAERTAATLQFPGKHAGGEAVGGLLKLAN